MDIKLLIPKIKILQDSVRGCCEDLIDDLIDDRQLQLADRADSELAKYHNTINELIAKLEKKPEKKEPFCQFGNIGLYVVEGGKQKVNQKIDKIQEDIEGVQSSIEQVISNVECEIETITASNCHLSDLYEDLNQLKTEIENLNNKDKKNE